jgi:hypothetical protein
MACGHGSGLQLRASDRSHSRRAADDGRQRTPQEHDDDARLERRGSFFCDRLRTSRGRVAPPIREPLRAENCGERVPCRVRTAFLLDSCGTDVPNCDGPIRTARLVEDVNSPTKAH